MDRTEEEGVQLLAPLRAMEPGVQSGVDVTRAIRRGKTHSRRRVMLGAVAAAVLIAVPVTVVPSLVHNATTDQPATPPVPMVGEFDMFTHVMSVGTAGGFAPYAYRTGRFEQAVDVAHTPGGRGYGRVTIYAPG